MQNQALGLALSARDCLFLRAVPEANVYKAIRPPDCMSCRCQGRWYLCDDSWVGEATEDAVRGCQAFQLFYSRSDVGTDAC